MDVRPFQALIFDLGGVIVPHDNAVLYDRLASRCAPSWPPERVGALVREGRWGTGAPICALHRQLSDEAGYGAAWETFVEDWCCHLSIDVSMLSLVQSLARNDRVMIFSNTNKQHWDFLVDLSKGALGRLEAFLSHEIGHEKPGLRSFQIVAEKAGVDPARSIFFDDLAANVQGARAAGFQAEVFEDQSRLETFLRSRGVEI